MNYVNVGHKSLLKHNVCILKDFNDESCSIGNRYLQLKIAHFLAMHAARQFRGNVNLKLLYNHFHIFIWLFWQCQTWFTSLLLTPILLYKHPLLRIIAPPTTPFIPSGSVEYSIVVSAALSVFNVWVSIKIVKAVVTIPVHSTAKNYRIRKPSNKLWPIRDSINRSPPMSKEEFLSSTPPRLKSIGKMSVASHFLQIFWYKTPFASMQLRKQEAEQDYSR